MLTLIFNGFLTRVNRGVALVEQELVARPDHSSLPLLYVFTPRFMCYDMSYNMCNQVYRYNL